MEIKHHHYFTIQPLDFDKAPGVLKEGYECLKMKKWLAAGTLLGLYREQDFILGDTDLDVEVEGYEGVDLDILDQVPFSLIRTIYHEGRVMQMAFIKDDTIFDIYILWPEGDKMVNVNEMGTMITDARFYSLGEIATKYGKFQIPSPVEEYLAVRYGKDWRTPKKAKGLYNGQF